MNRKMHEDGEKFLFEIDKNVMRTTAHAVMADRKELGHTSYDHMHEFLAKSVLRLLGVQHESD